MFKIFKRRRYSLPPSADPTSLGNLLIRFGFVTPLQLAQAADLQRSVQTESERLLGELLIAANALTRDQLLRALDEQAKLRKGGRPERLSVKDEMAVIVDLMIHRSRTTSASLEDLTKEAEKLTKETPAPPEDDKPKS